MSNETDLGWLARNVHNWPAGHQGWCYVISNRDGTKGVATSLIGQVDCPWVRIEKQEWLARRAGLQNKPCWNDAPEWAGWLAQDKSGAWWFFRCHPEAMLEGWDSNYSAYNHSSWVDGEVIGDWRDTLEKRPEEFQPFTSIEDNQEKAMKQDNGWHERGELPPVGVVCEAYIDYPPQWVEAEIVANKDGFAIGWCKSVMKGCHGNKASEFRPIRTERDELVNVFINHYGNPKGAEGYIGIADAILAAGFSRRDK